MKPVVDFVHSIGEVVNKLTLPSRQKKQLESELSQMIYTLEERIASEQNHLGTSGLDPGRSPGQLVATFVASPGHADICLYHPDRDIYRPPVIG